MNPCKIYIPPGLCILFKLHHHEEEEEEEENESMFLQF